MMEEEDDDYDKNGVHLERGEQKGAKVVLLTRPHSNFISLTPFSKNTFFF